MIHTCKHNKFKLVHTQRGKTSKTSSSASTGMERIMQGQSAELSRHRKPRPHPQTVVAKFIWSRKDNTSARWSHRFHPSYHPRRLLLLRRLDISPPRARGIMRLRLLQTQDFQLIRRSSNIRRASSRSLLLYFTLICLPQAKNSPILTSFSSQQQLLIEDSLLHTPPLASNQSLMQAVTTSLR